MKKIHFCTIIFCLVATTVRAINFSITVPAEATLFVGKASTFYKPFEEQTAANISTTGGKTTYVFDLTGQHNYRVSQDGKVTYAGLFTPDASNTSLEITAAMLAGNPKQIDRNVENNNYYNVADIFLNINPQGHLKLTNGASYQLVNLRSWQAINSIVGNYFIEPDFHYTVVNENGIADNSVVTVSKTGLLQAVSAGTAIVLVTYDAFHYKDGAGGTFFGAVWAENTGVFVVSVDAANTGITPNITINKDWNTDAANKMSTGAVDAELDVFYYAETSAGYDYTFTPTGVNSIELAQPTLGENSLSYTGFSTNGVTSNGDGSYTVRLVHGRNIVKLIADTGAEYQVLSAKPVSYAVTNASREGDVFRVGDEVSVLFNTLYHPCNKLAGVYNMTAGIQYCDIDPNSTAYGGVGQYTFASKAQTYEITIPEDYVGDEFILTKGMIKVSGNGDAFGNHRSITSDEGRDTNLSALIRTAYFGALPDIRIPVESSFAPSKRSLTVYPNPFADHIIVTVTEASVIEIYTFLGQCVLRQSATAGNNRIDTSNLPGGIYFVRCGNKSAKIIK